MAARISFKKNVIINIVGSILPLLIAVITVPLYLKVVGPARYGVLALVWLFAGYFSLLDFGISRATVNHISRSENREPSIQQKIFWSALWINLAVGVGGMVLAYPFAVFLFDYIKFDDPSIRAELIAAIPWLCLTVPVTVVSAVGVGGLEAKERFDLANLVQIAGSFLTQVAPVVVAYKIAVRLDYLILTIVVARLISMVFLLLALRYSFPLGKPVAWDFSIIKKLLSYGSWASVSGIISPVFDTLDRFVIGAKLGAGDVALYAVPFSIADKLRIIPRALGRAAFPKMSSLSEKEANVMYQELVKGSIDLMTPIILIGIFSANYLLHLWVGSSFGEKSFQVAVVLLCGACFNAVAFIPFVYLQARGRPNITARVHLIEFVPFVLALFLLVNYFGVVGAAMAWSGRMLVDCILLCFVARIERRTLVHLAASTLLLLAGAIYVIFKGVSLPVFIAVFVVIASVALIINLKNLKMIIGIKR